MKSNLTVRGGELTEMRGVDLLNINASLLAIIDKYGIPISH